MPDQELINLIQKYLDGTCTPEEQERIEAWYEEQSAGDLHFYDDDERRLRLSKERSLAVIRQQTRGQTFQQSYLKYLRIAAVLVVFVAAFLYFRSIPGDAPKFSAGPQHTDKILPGRNRALLTLADGKKIELSDAKTGIVIDASKLAYNDGEELNISGESSIPASAKMLTLSTPRGGTYQVILPDGTSVWLNAESSISFPSAFLKGDRRVQLAGEGYFEVARDKTKPFKVETPNGAEVQVTGTHFNVMAYEDENHFSTSLMEGAVRVVYRKNTVSLTPGQQALLSKETGSLQKKSADVEEAIAWKNGYFMFSEENIHSIMRKVSRWYEVEVEYKGDMKGKDFSGTVSRYKDVSEVLQMLELTGIIHFSIQGRRIIVMP